MRPAALCVILDLAPASSHREQGRGRPRGDCMRPGPRGLTPQPPAASRRGVTQEPSTRVILNLPRERDSLRCGPLTFPMARLPNALRREVAMEISVKVSYPPRCLCILLPPPVPHCVIVSTSSACYFSLHCLFIYTHPHTCICVYTCSTHSACNTYVHTHTHVHTNMQMHTRIDT